MGCRETMKRRGGNWIQDSRVVAEEDANIQRRNANGYTPDEGDDTYGSAALDKPSVFRVGVCADAPQSV